MSDLRLSIERTLMGDLTTLVFKLQLNIFMYTTTKYYTTLTTYILYLFIYLGVFKSFSCILLCVIYTLIYILMTLRCLEVVYKSFTRFDNRVSDIAL